MAILGPSSYFVAKGIIPADQAAALIPAVVTIVPIMGGIIIGKFASNAHSAAALTIAVNNGAAPGVKVVPNYSPTPAVNINAAGAIVPAGDIDAPKK